MIAAPDPDRRTDIIRMAAAFAQASDRLQWASPVDIRAHQDKALAAFIRHARMTVPFYADRLIDVLSPDGTLNRHAWPSVQPLSRAMVAENLDRLQTTSLPVSHGMLHNFASSGTSGLPLEGVTTSFARMHTAIMQVRAKQWVGVDYHLNRAQIIHHVQGHDTTYPGKAVDGSWAPIWANDRRSGTWHQLDHSTPHRQQLAWLREKGRCYLSIIPNSGIRLAELVLAGEAKPDIAAIFSCGEIVTDAYRDLVRRAFGCTIWDTYASEEAGCIACQCPSGNHLHINDDHLLVEILDTNDQPCAPGQPGEIVVTPFYNYQMPLIRYRTGDIGVPGAPCTCGRGLTSLASVEGRLREVFYFANGESFVPGISPILWQRCLNATIHQTAQVDIDTVEFRFVSDTPEHEQDRAGFIAGINRRFPCGMTYRFRQMATIPGHDKPKFTYQICELPPTVPRHPPVRL